MKSVKSLSESYSSSESLKARLTLSFTLMAAIWVLGLVGHFTPLLEWPALFLYVIGSIGLVLYRGKKNGECRRCILPVEISESH